MWTEEWWMHIVRNENVQTLQLLLNIVGHFLTLINSQSPQLQLQSQTLNSSSPTPTTFFFFFFFEIAHYSFFLLYIYLFIFVTINSFNHNRPATKIFENQTKAYFLFPFFFFPLKALCSLIEIQKPNSNSNSNWIGLVFFFC